MEEKINRRTVEELMIKLLLGQQNDKDIQYIIEINEYCFRSNNANIGDYFSKHIQTYCSNNIYKILPKISNSTLQQKIKDFCLPQSTNLNKTVLLDLEKEIKSRLNNNEYQHIPEDYLLTYLTNIEHSINYQNYILNEVKGIQLVFDVLNKGDMNNKHQILKFINEIYVKSNDIDKLYLLKAVINEIQYSIKKKQDEILCLLINENQMNGIPGITIQQTKQYLDLHVSNQNHDKDWVNMYMNTTVFKLLTSLIVEFNINVDLYNITYYINNKEGKPNIIDCSKLKYISSLTDIFSIPLPQEENTLTSITINLKQQNAIDNETLYFSNHNHIKQDIAMELKRLFKGKDLINVSSLFSYLNNNQLTKIIQNIFKEINFIDFESLITHLEKKNEKCFLLLHLLIGFREKDINKPYCRNIFPEDMICIKLNQYHLFNIKENNIKDIIEDYEVIAHNSTTNTQYDFEIISI